MGLSRILVRGTRDMVLGIDSIGMIEPGATITLETSFKTIERCFNCGRGKDAHGLRALDCPPEAQDMVDPAAETKQWKDPPPDLNTHFWPEGLVTQGGPGAVRLDGVIGFVVVEAPTPGVPIIRDQASGRITVKRTGDTPSRFMAALFGYVTDGQPVPIVYLVEKVPAHATLAISVRAEMAFIPESVTVDSDCGDVFNIHDIAIGNLSQLVATGAIPAGVFGGVGPRMRMDSCLPGTIVSMKVENTSDAESLFVARVAGSDMPALEQEQGDLGVRIAQLAESGAETERIRKVIEGINAKLVARGMRPALGLAESGRSFHEEMRAQRTDEENERFDRGVQEMAVLRERYALAGPAEREEIMRDVMAITKGEK